MNSSCTRGCSSCILGKIIVINSGEVSEWAAEGGGGVTIPGSFQEVCKCGTKEHGLVSMVLMGQPLN